MIKRMVRLRDNRFRRREKAVLVDGWREISQAIGAGLELVRVFVSPESLSASMSESDADLRAKIIGDPQAAKWLTTVSESLMEKIGFGHSHRGVVAEFREPERTVKEFSQCIQSTEPFLLVLDNIEKPGNIGAVFRCADAAGVDGILITGGAVGVWNPNAIRNSLGAVFTVPFAIADDSEAAEFLNQQNTRVFAARVESSQKYTAVDFSGPVAIVLGSEAGGLGDRWKTLGGQPIQGIQIPMKGKVDSLNVSVSAAILAFYAAEQRSNRE